MSHAVDAENVIMAFPFSCIAVTLLCDVIVESNLTYIVDEDAAYSS